MDPVVVSILSSAIILIAMFSITSLAGLVSERSGIVNISLEGTMVMGGMMFAILMQFSQFVDNTWGPFVALMLSIIVGVLYSQLLSAATIPFMADHVIAGTALNMLAPAISIIVITQAFGTQRISIPASVINQGWAGGVDTLSLIFLIVTIVILVAAWVLLNKTHWGLRLKSSGENPYALETSGISVNKTRWIALSIAGGLAAMGGVFAIINLNAFFGGVNGQGFIALGILIIGRWKIVGIAIGTIIMAVPLAFASSWETIPAVVDKFPSEIMQMIPFLIPLISLMIFKIFGDKIYSGPKSTGKPFKKNMR